MTHQKGNTAFLKNVGKDMLSTCPLLFVKNNTSTLKGKKKMRSVYIKQTLLTLWASANLVMADPGDSESNCEVTTRLPLFLTAGISFAVAAFFLKGCWTLLHLPREQRTGNHQQLLRSCELRLFVSAIIGSGCIVGIGFTCLSDYPPTLTK